jgi:hypothetical protein
MSSPAAPTHPTMPAMQKNWWSAPLIAVALALPAPAGADPLTFIHDDFDRARAESSARKLPLVVEVWAPW